GNIAPVAYATPPRRRTRVEIELGYGSCLCKAAFTSTSSDPQHRRGAVTARIPLSAPAGAIHRTASVCGGAYAPDAGCRHRACDRPRTQHDAWPYGAARRILDILAVDDG